MKNHRQCMMSWAETLILGTGAAVSKAVLKLWLRDNEIAKASGLAVVDILAKKLPDMNQRRRTEREFERIAEEVAEKLTPFFVAEAKSNILDGATEDQKKQYQDPNEVGMGNTELNAVALSVADTLNQATFDIEYLFENDLEPRHIEKSLESISREKIKDLDEIQRSMFKIILRECCSYVVEIESTLPSFNLSSTREILKREGTIIELVKKVLEELPKIYEKDQDKDHAFSDVYRRSLPRKLDRLAIFGLPSSTSTRRYSLTISYITLVVNPSEDELPSSKFLGAVSRAFSVRSKSNEQKFHHLGADEAVAQNERTLIKGEAGSGKTTFLQWLAVQASRQSFRNSLESWNGCTPFFLQLRHYSSASLPAPEAFLDKIAPSIAGEMPDGWVHRILRKGRGLVLIDGVDELPESRRYEVKEWLQELIAEFPRTKFIVTSRPTAARQGWLNSCGFTNCILQPMDLQSINNLVDKWHSAADKEELAQSTEVQDMGKIQERLKQILRIDAQVRSLATSPLLCAMICALHFERKDIPRNRMEVYRIALDMLLDRRDKERGARFEQDLHLDQEHQQALLEEFAYWLLQYRRSQANRTETEVLLKHTLQILGKQDDGGSALNYLLERSGLIREPAIGQVDFIHRTFQEYLAAKAMASRHEVLRLIKKSEDPQLRDVIIIAAGHASHSECDKLINGILKRAHQEPRNRHHLVLLATACLETAVRLSPDIREAVQKQLQEVVPPKDHSEARSLAAAGSLVSAHLSGYSRADLNIISACIQTLSLIADDEALSIMNEYCLDDREEVHYEIFRSLSNYESVSELTQLTKLHLPNTAISDISGLAGLPSLRYLNLNYTRISTLNSLENVNTLREIEIAGCSIDSLDGISNLYRLVRLCISGCGKISDLSPIQNLGSLEELDLTECVQITNLEPIRHLVH